MLKRPEVSGRGRLPACFRQPIYQATDPTERGPPWALMLPVTPRRGRCIGAALLTLPPQYQERGEILSQTFMTDSVSTPGGGVTSITDGTQSRSHAGLFGLALGSIGVVYGDIGTSPLYAFREAIIAASGPNTTKRFVTGTRRSSAAPYLA